MDRRWLCIIATAAICVLVSRQPEPTRHAVDPERLSQWQAQSDRNSQHISVALQELSRTLRLLTEMRAEDRRQQERLRIEVQKLRELIDGDMHPATGGTPGRTDGGDNDP